MESLNPDRFEIILSLSLKKKKTSACLQTENLSEVVSCKVKRSKEEGL